MNKNKRAIRNEVENFLNCYFDANVESDENSSQNEGNPSASDEAQQLLKPFHGMDSESRSNCEFNENITGVSTTSIHVSYCNNLFIPCRSCL